MGSLDDYPEYEDPLHDALLAARETMDVSDLADAWLRILAEDGSLPDVSETVITHKGKPLTRPITKDPVNTPSDPSVHPARLDNGQVIWVKLEKRRLSDALVSASVADKPNSVGAVLAALTMMESDAVDIEQLQRFVPLVDLSHPEGISESVNEVLIDLLSRGRCPKPWSLSELSRLGQFALLLPCSATTAPDSTRCLKKRSAIS